MIWIKREMIFYYNIDNMSNYGVPDNDNNNGMLPYLQANGVSGGQQPYYSQTNTQYQQQTSYVQQNYNMMPLQQQIQYTQPGNLQVYNQYQQYQSNGNSSVQLQQPVYYQQIPQQQQYNQQYAHQQYANYNNAAAPHPPSNQSNQYNNSHNTNANVAASLRQSLSSTTSNQNNNKKPESKSKKKINPKMAKKYSGRGLKTITISGPGLPTQRFKICVGNHPDDIKKWIEERKKRFPRRDGSHKKYTSLSSSSPVAGMKRSRLEDEGEDKEDENGKRPYLDNSTVKSETSESKSEAGGLSSLLAGYGSSSSDEDESINSPAGKADIITAQEEGKVKNESTTTEMKNPSPPKRLCTYYQRGNCRHGASCKFLHSDKPINSTTQNNNKRQSQSERDKARNQYEQELKILGLATPSHGSRYTSGGKVINNTSLLHQLLARDKERERSLTLQLLRYIVDCDYFQKDGNDNTSGTRQRDNDDNEQSGDKDDTAK